MKYFFNKTTLRQSRVFFEGLDISTVRNIMQPTGYGPRLHYLALINLVNKLNKRLEKEIFANDRNNYMRY